MMNEPPKSESGEGICPICNKPKIKHSPDEVLACSLKMREYDDAKKDDV